MTTVRIIIGLAVAVMVAVLWGQYRQISLQHDLIAMQSDITDQLHRGIQDLQDAAAQTRDQMSDLLQAQQRVQSNLAARNNEIRRLQTDVQEIRDWADQPLPADIQRLLRQPAVTGAAGYGAAMSAGDPVHDGGGGPDKKR